MTTFEFRGLRLIFLTLACLASVATGRVAAAAPVGDRLVVSINGESYTQRQLELYITVKEILRRTENGKVRLLAPSDWRDALQVFTEDMLILQESTRLGSFSAVAEGGSAQLVQKYDQIVKDKIAKQAPLRDALRRLGAEEVTTARTLETVLRVAMFRLGKDRQAQIVADGAKSQNEADVDLAPEALTKPGTARRGGARWLTELEERAVVRRYEGAENYQEIQPTLGKTANGL